MIMEVLSYDVELTYVKVCEKVCEKAKLSPFFGQRL